MINCLSRVRAGIGNQTLYHIGRHLLHQLLGVIGHHVINDAARILIRQGCDNGLLLVDLQIGKNVRRLILWQNAKNLYDFLLFHLLQIIRDIRIV